MAVRDQPFFAELVMDSEEYDRWAREIADGNWLGQGTFFQAPLYPYLLALTYALLGRHYDAVYLWQIALAVAGCWALYRAGILLLQDAREGQRHGLLAATLAALYAPFVFYDVHLLKESLAVTLSCFLLWALMAGRRSLGSKAPWWAAGLVLGLLALLRENVLVVVPLLLLLAFPRDPGVPVHMRWRTTGRRSGILLAAMFLVLLPVALRNGLVGGSYLPTTFQGGTNFYIGNHAEADGTYQPIAVGKQVPRFERGEPIRMASQDLGRELSASEVSAYWLGRSLEWIRAEPGDFLRLQLRKLAMYWRWYEWPDAVDYEWVRGQSLPLRLLPFEFGSITLLALAGLWSRRRSLFAQDLPMVLWIVGWTASTVIFFIFSRYRIPMMPALLLWAAEPLRHLLNAVDDLRRGEDGGTAASRRLLAWVLLLAVALPIPRWVAPPPRLDLVHYNLGVLDRESGQYPEAEEHFLRAMEANPDHFMAAMNLGRMGAMRRDYGTAERWLRHAADLEPTSDDVQANLGALYLTTRRPELARQALERALELNPSHPQAKKNLEVLEDRFPTTEPTP